MKTKFPPAISPRAARKGIFSRLQTRIYRLPAHVTREDDWKADSPNIKLSRVFGIVLGIHLVAIGGLMAYEMFRHKDGASAGTPPMKPAPREVRNPSSSTPGAPAAARTRESLLSDPANASLMTHVVGPGEKLSDIAQHYQVEETALIEKNQIDQGHPFESGMKLLVPARSTAPTVIEDPKKLLAAAPVAPASKETPAARRATPVGDSTPEPQAMVPVEPSSPDKPVRRAEPAGTTKAGGTPRSGKPATPSAGVAAAKQPGADKKKPASTRPASTPPPPKGRVHVVKEGENAYRIARSYGVNVDKLVRTNGIKPELLRPGTTLVIPPNR